MGFFSLFHKSLQRPQYDIDEKGSLLPFSLPFVKTLRRGCSRPKLECSSRLSVVSSRNRDVVHLCSLRSMALPNQPWGHLGMAWTPHQTKHLISLHWNGTPGNLQKDVGIQLMPTVSQFVQPLVAEPPRVNENQKITGESNRWRHLSDAKEELR